MVLSCIEYTRNQNQTLVKRVILNCIYDDQRTQLYKILACHLFEFMSYYHCLMKNKKKRC